MRKIIVISGIVLLIAAAAYLGFKYLYISPDQPVIQTFSTKQNPAFKAVPQKSPLIIEVKNQEGFFNAFKAENPALAEFKGIPQFEFNLTEMHFSGHWKPAKKQINYYFG